MKKLNKKDVLGLIEEKKKFIDYCKKFEKDFGIEIIYSTPDIHIYTGITKLRSFADSLEVKERNDINFPCVIVLHFGDVVLYQIGKSEGTMEDKV